MDLDIEMYGLFRCTDDSGASSEDLICVSPSEDKLKDRYIKEIFFGKNKDGELYTERNSEFINDIDLKYLIVEIESI